MQPPDLLIGALLICFQVGLAKLDCFSGLSRHGGLDCFECCAKNSG